MTIPRRRDLAGSSAPARVPPGTGSESEEELSAVTAGSPALTHWAPDSRFHPGHTKMDAIRRGSAKDSQRHRVHLEAQGAVTQNFSESKQDTEYVSAPPGGGAGPRAPGCSSLRAVGTPCPGPGAAAGPPSAQNRDQAACPRGRLEGPVRLQAPRPLGCGKAQSPALPVRLASGCPGDSPEPSLI